MILLLVGVLLSIATPTSPSLQHNKINASLCFWRAEPRYAPSHNPASPQRLRLCKLSYTCTSRHTQHHLACSHISCTGSICGIYTTTSTAECFHVPGSQSMETPTTESTLLGWKYSYDLPTVPTVLLLSTYFLTGSVPSDSVFRATLTAFLGTPVEFTDQWSNTTPEQHRGVDVSLQLSETNLSFAHKPPINNNFLLHRVVVVTPPSLLTRKNKIATQQQSQDIQDCVSDMLGLSHGNSCTSTSGHADCKCDAAVLHCQKQAGLVPTTDSIINCCTNKLTNRDTCGLQLSQNKTGHACSALECSLVGTERLCSNWCGATECSAGEKYPIICGANGCPLQTFVEKQCEQDLDKPLIELINDEHRDACKYVTTWLDCVDRLQAIECNVSFNRKFFCCTYGTLMSSCGTGTSIDICNGVVCQEPATRSCRIQSEASVISTQIEHGNLTGNGVGSVALISCSNGHSTDKNVSTSCKYKITIPDTWDSMTHWSLQVCSCDRYKSVNGGVSLANGSSTSQQEQSDVVGQQRGRVIWTIPSNVGMAMFALQLHEGTDSDIKFIPAPYTIYGNPRQNGNRDSISGYINIPTILCEAVSIQLKTVTLTPTITNTHTLTAQLDLPNIPHSSADLESNHHPCRYHTCVHGVCRVKNISTNGIANHNNEQFYCKCNVGWEGDMCQQRDCWADCSPIGTLNCITTTAGTKSTCFCKSGYYGARCDLRNRNDIRVQQCGLYGCAAGMVCMKQYDDSFQCQCEFSDNPECTDVNKYCSSSPCQNGATCTPIILPLHSISYGAANNDTTQSVICTCRESYYGRHCELYSPMDACAAQRIKCVNGVCMSGKCMCRDGWVGTTCNKLPVVGNPGFFMSTHHKYPDCNHELQSIKDKCPQWEALEEHSAAEIVQFICRQPQQTCLNSITHHIESIRQKGCVDIHNHLIFIPLFCMSYTWSNSLSSSSSPTATPLDTSAEQQQLEIHYCTAEVYNYMFAQIQELNQEPTTASAQRITAICHSNCFMSFMREYRKLAIQVLANMRVAIKPASVGGFIIGTIQKQMSICWGTEPSVTHQCFTTFVKLFNDGRINHGEEAFYHDGQWQKQWCTMQCARSMLMKYHEATTLSGPVWTSRRLGMLVQSMKSFCSVRNEHETRPHVYCMDRVANTINYVNLPTFGCNKLEEWNSATLGCCVSTFKDRLTQIIGSQSMGCEMGRHAKFACAHHDVWYKVQLELTNALWWMNTPESYPLLKRDISSTLGIPLEFVGIQSTENGGNNGYSHYVTSFNTIIIDLVLTDFTRALTESTVVLLTDHLQQLPGLDTFYLTSFFLSNNFAKNNLIIPYNYNETVQSGTITLRNIDKETTQNSANAPPRVTLLDPALNEIHEYDPNEGLHLPSQPDTNLLGNKAEYYNITTRIKLSHPEMLFRLYLNGYMVGSNYGNNMDFPPQLLTNHNFQFSAPILNPVLIAFEAHRKDASVGQESSDESEVHIRSGSSIGGMFESSLGTIHISNIKNNNIMSNLWKCTNNKVRGWNILNYTLHTTSENWQTPINWEEEAIWTYDNVDNVNIYCRAVIDTKDWISQSKVGNNNGDNQPSQYSPSINGTNNVNGTTPTDTPAPSSSSVNSPTGESLTSVSYAIAGAVCMLAVFLAAMWIMKYLRNRRKMNLATDMYSADTRNSEFNPLNVYTIPMASHAVNTVSNVTHSELDQPSHFSWDADGKPHPAVQWDDDVEEYSVSVVEDEDEEDEEADEEDEEYEEEEEWNGDENV